MGLGARLQEERNRLGLRQADFAERAGSDAQKQSLYETEKRELRGAYLASIAELGVDVQYVLTGHRSGAGLSDFSTNLVGTVEQLNEHDRSFVMELARRLAEGPAASARFHEERVEFRHGGDD